jgi:hypothetical protein
MRVEIVNTKDLLIEPETDFETQFLLNFGIGDVFHKYGLTPANLVGILIKRKDR